MNYVISSAQFESARLMNRITSLKMPNGASLPAHNESRRSNKGVVERRGICYTYSMPYKDIENRRKAWRRWRDRNYEKHKKRSKIQYQASSANPIRQECSVLGCKELGERHHPDYSKPKQIVWLCKKHHEAVHHNRRCTICGGKHRARGLCNAHWKKWRKGNL